MTLVLLLFSAFFIGRFVRDMALGGLTALNRVRQGLRLEKLIRNSSSPPGTQKLLSFLGKPASVLVKMEITKKYTHHLSRQLERINRPDISPAQILGSQLLFSFGSAGLFGLLSGIPELAFIAFLIGLSFPLLWLRDMALKRENRLLRELPNAIEILSLCSEAGLTLEQGMDQYLKHAKSGPLKEEFTVILEQARTGSSRKNALSAVNERLQLTDFSLFSTSLIQAEKFGTGISKTLRQLSLSLRDKQFQRAEKTVQEMPVKMILPLVLFIMPVTFLIIFGPILMQFLKP